MSYLFDNLIREFGKRDISRVTIPRCISDNLRKEFEIRPYQKESFQHFILCYNEDFSGKPPNPIHLMFNMATGSGKTLIMAGLILYLYERGYRDFLFFVNSSNIIKKTKDNFLNSSATKYLFNNRIIINGSEVLLKETENFENTDTRNINIKFTTIQQLHIDLNNTKENSITYEDFQQRRIVLIADEAHHLSSSTKNNGDLFGSWEGTVLGILKMNFGNILLEFTATLDYENLDILNKYQDKIIFKYDLSQFRNDKYSKEISLIRSLYGEKERILQSLVINLYRQELATVYEINLKPVILFKAKKTIKESEQNKLNFHRLIDDLTSEMIDKIRLTSTVPIVQKAFRFFDSKKISSSEICSRLKSDFKVENCISANNDQETEVNQIRLNTLEDENNPIRAIFAVQKLNEGWDVLNLFDIVRLYEGQNTGGSNVKIGKTTMSEAQLIGRGARYFPFVIREGEDKFTRKYDLDTENDLRVLEELYYHTKEDNRYISELKKALIESGLYEDEDKFDTKELSLKSEFKKTDFYLSGRVLFNKKIEKRYDKVRSFSDLGVSKKNFAFTLSSGIGTVTGVFQGEESSLDETLIKKDIDLFSIPKHIKRYALSRNPFFHYINLSHFFPNLPSISQFINGDGYLRDLTVTVVGNSSRIKEITNEDYLQILQGLLTIIESEIKSNLIEFEGSDFIYDYIHEVFKDKSLKIRKDDERSDGQESLIQDKPWYVYNANYGTSEEKSFVSMFARRIELLYPKFKNIYLIRNERELKIYDKFGRAFEPDFLLFCRENEGGELTYQVFIEPKGSYLFGVDKWKEDFLKEIRDKKHTFKIESDLYLITGVPFYNNENENEFGSKLEETLSIYKKGTKKV